MKSSVVEVRMGPSDEELDVRVADPIDKTVLLGCETEDPKERAGSGGPFLES
jgi:hypothetical protein